MFTWKSLTDSALLLQQSDRAYLDAEGCGDAYYYVPGSWGGGGGGGAGGRGTGGGGVGGGHIANGKIVRASVIGRGQLTA